MINIALLRATLVGAFICLAGTANATTYTWTWTENGGELGSGTLTTGSSCGAGCELITALGGTFYGVAIDALLDPGLFPSSHPNDNHLLSTSAHVLDGNGISFTLASITNNVNIYYDDISTTYRLCAGTSDCGLTSPGTFAVEAASATPAPAALPLCASGLGLFGLLGWRRKRKHAVAGLA
jgi:hypothetical protein